MMTWPVTGATDSVSTVGSSLGSSRFASGEYEAGEREEQGWWGGKNPASESETRCCFVSRFWRPSLRNGVPECSTLTGETSATLFFFENPKCQVGYEASMVTIHFPKASQEWWTNGETKILPKNASTNNPRSRFPISNVSARSSLVCGSSNDAKELRSHYIWMNPKQKSTNRGPILPICASLDEDYRSSRNIAISLFRRYRNVVDRGGAENLKEFINVGVNAYALGCTDEGLRKELLNLKETGVEIEGLRAYGGSTSLKYKVLSEETQECILWLSIIFITILCTPQPTVIRWSSTPPVSDEIMVRWKGFCALIANAYYVKGMAWLPVKTLQLEQLAVTGSAEEPSVVSSRMQLVFSTLEVVSPQWPRV